MSATTDDVSSSHDDLIQSEKGFTEHFIKSLTLSRARVDNFCAAMKKKADEAFASNSEAVRAEQQSIQDLLTQLRSLQEERGELKNSNDKESLAVRRTRLIEKQTVLEKEKENLMRGVRSRQLEFEEVCKEEMIQCKRADEKRQSKAMVEEAKKTTVEDLTTGILHYKKLGLDFQQAGDNELRFIFTCLDPNDPKRPFKFILSSATDGFQVEECDPPLRVPALMMLVEHLNESPDDNFSSFLSRMRNAFQDSILV